MNYQHQNLASGHWQDFSLVEQLANVGAEVGRALSWQAKGEKEMSQRALDRGLELFALTMGDRRWRYRLKEIARAKEVVCDYFFGNNQYQSTPESLKKYFLQFAIAARNIKT